MAADCAKELRKHGVSYVSLWPGLVQTEVLKENLENKTNDPLLKKVGKGQDCQAPIHTGGTGPSWDRPLAHTWEEVGLSDLRVAWGPQKPKTDSSSHTGSKVSSAPWPVLLNPH